jgi:L-alanine-DL-glutamate epimerase-like enolase superfamily enzyme
MQLLFHPFDLRLKHTFTIAHDSRDSQPTLIVELRDESGSGFGEATSNPYYGATIEGMTVALTDIRGVIEGYKWGTPEELWTLVHPFLKDNPFAQCALDVAAHDLYARKHNVALYRSWGLTNGSIPATNYTIGIDRLEVMVAKLTEFPWPLYKIKLGTDHDLEIVRELRKYTDSPFRIDANCAWTAEEAIANSGPLKELGVEFIEQPLPASDVVGMREVYRHSALPVIADESCIVEKDVADCGGLFHGINIKLTKCGGLTPALRMIAHAKELGLKVMVGCMTESSVGIAAIGHLLPLLDYVDMDGNLLIANDPASGVYFGPDARFIYQNSPGTGAVLH